MVKLIIDNIPVEVEEGTTILDAAKSIGIFLPTLCYLEGINDIGTCRVCVVEVEGRDRLVTSCNTAAEEGMVVHTNSQRARKARSINVQLVLSQHDASCASCVRSGNCILQSLSHDLGILDNRFDKDINPDDWDKSFPIIRHESKCIKCMRCVQICNNMQEVGVWDSINSGGYTSIGVTGGRKITESDCTLCAQCVTHCPVGALRERDDTGDVFDAISDPDRIVVAQLAPAVRAAWGESLGMPRDYATAKRLVTALKRIGFDYVYDTTFTADLTVMEEGQEFIKVLTKGNKEDYPLMTSCCPGWVRFIKANYPNMVSHLSTAKSPQQMFGAVVKTDLARRLKVDRRKICSVSIMPCVAKKAECTLPTMRDLATGDPDVDISLTTREISRMISACHININKLEETDFDKIPGERDSGAGVIFGVTGGVMEAALRTVYYLVTGKTPDLNAFHDIRGREGWREATFMLDGEPVNVAVASGLGNARKLMEAIVKGEVHYHFVEVMACPGGCSGGGGQPIMPNVEMAEVRQGNLYQLDEKAAIRFSHENPGISKLYDRNPGISHRLHTDHNGWEMPLAPGVVKK